MSAEQNKLAVVGIGALIGIGASIGALSLVVILTPHSPPVVVHGGSFDANSTICLSQSSNQWTTSAVVTPPLTLYLDGVALPGQSTFQSYTVPLSDTWQITFKYIDGSHSVTFKGESFTPFLRTISIADAGDGKWTTTSPCKKGSGEYGHIIYNVNSCNGKSGGAGSQCDHVNDIVVIPDATNPKTTTDYICQQSATGCVISLGSPP